MCMLYFQLTVSSIKEDGEANSEYITKYIFMTISIELSICFICFIYCFHIKYTFFKIFVSIIRSLTFWYSQNLWFVVNNWLHAFFAVLHRKRPLISSHFNRSQNVSTYTSLLNTLSTLARVSGYVSAPRTLYKHSIHQINVFSPFVASLPYLFTSSERWA